MTAGDVNITVSDGGGAAVVVPQANVFVVMGCSSAGTVAQVVATRNPDTIRATFGYGPLVEAAALLCLRGGTVLCMRATSNTAGLITGSGGSAKVITGATVATPSVITSVAHGFTTGQVVVVASVGGTTTVNGTWVITVLTADTFSLNGSTGTGAYTSGGTATATGATFVGTGTSVITLTGAPYDDCYVKVVVIAGGTIGTTGITFKWSLDAGRNYSPTISLGTANTYALVNTNVVLNFAAGTLVAADVFTFGTTAPAWNDAGISACETALGLSAYAITGWGGQLVAGIGAGTDATAIEGYLDTFATNDIFTRLIMSARDASPPIAYGGTAETDAAWVASIQTSFSAVSAKRVGPGGGFYNTPSAYPILGTIFTYRRPLAWSWAARQVQIAAQTHAGRVSDGALATITLDPINDPLDGFVYHDERSNPGLTGARFCAAKTRIRKPGIFIDQPGLMSPLGSVFTIWPFGAVMDIGCTILVEESTELINSDIRLNANGTIHETEAKTIETTILAAINDNMTAVGMLSQAGPGNSGAVVTVDRTNNVRTQKAVNIALTLYGRGYIFTVNATIGFAS